MRSLCFPSGRPDIQTPFHMWLEISYMAGDPSTKPLPIKQTLVSDLPSGARVKCWDI